MITFEITDHDQLPGEKVVVISRNGRLIATVTARMYEDAPMIRVLSHKLGDVWIDAAMPPPMVVIRLTEDDDGHGHNQA